MFQSVCAAAAVAAAAVLFVVTPAPSAHASFQDVQAECAKARNVRFTMVQKLLKTSPEVTMRVTAEGRRLRMDVADVVSLIFDVEARTGVELNRQAKQFRPQTVTEKAFKAMPNFVDDVSQLPAPAAADVTTEKLGGKDVRVYRLKKFKFFGMDNTGSKEDDGLLTVWADPAAKLPVRVEVKVYQERAKEWSTIRLKDFDWSVDLADGFFDTRAPAGYTEAPAIDPKTGLPAKK